MDRSTLKQTLRQMLEEDRGEPYAKLDEDSNLREELGLDSVDLISLVMQVQDRFRVVLATEELEHVATVKDLLDVLQSKLAALPRAA